MKFLIFADLQASDGHERCFCDPLIPLQRWRVQKTMELLKTLYTDHECDGLIDLGDTTDDRQAIPIPTIQALITPLSHFKGGKNIKLIGNHEQWLRSTAVHPGAIYDPFFTVIDHSGVVAFKDCPVVFACVSFIDDHEQFSAEILSTVEKAASYGKKVILLGHGPIKGAVASGRALNDGLDGDTIAHVDLGLFGHIHKHQKIKDNLFYIGSPFEQDFGESGDKKYVAILDTDDLTLKWVDTKMPTYRRVTFGQFQELVQEESENRYEVRLSSYDESVTFFSHPLSNRATATYDYEQSARTKKDQDEDMTFDFDTSSLLAAYVDRCPPQSVGLSLSSEDLVQCGQNFIHS